MARIELSPAIQGDFNRILDHLARHDVPNTAARVNEIIQAINVLEFNPLIGRPGAGEMHELVIGKGARGYGALYRYVAALDTVFLLSIRSQREAGYTR